MRKLMLSSVALLLTVSCAMLTVPYGTPIESGGSIPEGKVLLIGEFVLNPPVKARGKDKDVINLYMTNDLRGTIVTDSISGILRNPAMDEGMLVKFTGLSSIALSPGERYIRYGRYMKYNSVSGGYWGSGPGQGSSPTVEEDSIDLVKDIKISLPANAKAVYIGKIIFQHDNSRAIGVKIVDNYEDAMQEFAKLKIAGVKTSDIKKKLAVLIAKK